jgi:hypothetical protein
VGAVRFDGAWVFIYTKRQQAIIPMLAGIALFIFPYLITDITLPVIIGAILVIFPYFHIS